jgi:hypothetical protein
MFRAVRRAEHVVSDVDTRLAAIFFFVVLNCEKFRMERPAAEERICDATGDMRALVAE